jgi:hypothetical protein
MSEIRIGIKEEKVCGPVIEFWSLKNRGNEVWFRDDEVE